MWFYTIEGQLAYKEFTWGILSDFLDEIEYDDTTIGLDWAAFDGQGRGMMIIRKGDDANKHKRRLKIKNLYQGDNKNGGAEQFQRRRFCWLSKINQGLPFRSVRHRGILR